MPAEESYPNPVDGKTYVAPGGWKTYRPQGAPPESQPAAPGQKVKMGPVRLLTAQDDMDARTSVKDLAAFITEAVRLAEEPLGRSGKPLKVMVQFTCTPAGHEVKLASQGEAPQELLQDYYDALLSAKRLPVKADEVSFQVEVSVSP